MHVTIVEIATGLLRSLGLAALVAMGYGLLLRWGDQAKRNVFTGLLFGWAAVAAMLDPIVFAPGVVFDARAVMVALAGPFGGPAAAAISAAMAGAFRLWHGGIGAAAGLAGIAIAGSAGLLFAALVPKQREPAHLLALGLMASTMVFSIFLIPWDVAIAAFGKAAIPIVATNCIGIVLVGLFLAEEERRHDCIAAMTAASETDALTKLFNRRKLDRLAFDLAGAGDRQPRSFAAIMVDIDHFKRVNDRYGHAAGDAVLAQIADIVAKRTRRSDLAVRYGGEELAVVLPETGLDNALTVADAIRHTIERTCFAWGNASLRVTVSAGVSVSTEDCRDLASVMAAADRAMYEAKRMGRNRVHRAAPALGEATPAGRQAVEPPAGPQAARFAAAGAGSRQLA